MEGGCRAADIKLMEVLPSGAHWTGDKASPRGSMDGV
jgi:hypothetical protein